MRLSVSDVELYNRVSDLKQESGLRVLAGVICNRCSAAPAAYAARNCSLKSFIAGLTAGETSASTGVASIDCLPAVLCCCLFSSSLACSRFTSELRPLLDVRLCMLGNMLLLSNLFALVNGCATDLVGDTMFMLLLFGTLPVTVLYRLRNGVIVVLTFSAACCVERPMLACSRVKVPLNLPLLAIRFSFWLLLCVVAGTCSLTICFRRASSASAS